jgi:hypothetical protein
MGVARRLLFAARMKMRLVTLWRDDRAQDMAEYGIALATLAISAAAAAMAIRDHLHHVWSSVTVLTVGL